MSSLQTARGIMALAFKKSELVYLHCVSKEKFGVTLKGFTCISLICREAHVSYIEKMSERRRCLVPDVVEHQPVDALFEDQGTPLLVRINSSCVVLFFYFAFHKSQQVKSCQLYSLLTCDHKSLVTKNYHPFLPPYNYLLLFE